jgi:MFS family permease
MIPRLVSLSHLTTWVVFLAVSVRPFPCPLYIGAFSHILIVNFWIGNPLGRKKVIWLAASIIIIGAVLQCSAYSIPHLVIGRIITGIGTGLETSTVPMYQSELCQGNMRGRLVSAEVLFVGVGITIA